MQYFIDLFKRLTVFALSFFSDQKQCSDLHQIFSHIIYEQEKDLEEKLKPWYGFHRKGVDVKDYHNNPIRFYGVDYKGRPQRIFWDYVPAFLSLAIKTALQQCAEAIALKSFKDSYIIEVQELLKSMTRHILNEMAHIDGLLRGKNAKLRDVTALIQHYDEEISHRINNMLMKNLKK